MKPGPTIQSLQILRGIAASAVVLHHTIRAVLLYSFGQNGDAAANYPWLAEWLAIGVDVFFLISGFIMVYISPPYVQGKKPLYDFAMMRIIRIYPVYLTATVLLLSIQTASFALSRGSGFNLDFGRILSAVLLFPSFNERGLVQPILGVGWTLSYEILFYIVFYISLMLRSNINFLLMSFIILVSINIFARLVPDNNTALQLFFRDRIMFEFAFGCVIAMVYMKGLLQRLSVWLLLGLFLATLALSLVSSSHSEHRFISYGFVSAAGVLLLLRFEDGEFRHWPRLLLLIGEASYSIYIFHTLILYFLLMPVISHLHIGSLTGWQAVLTISAISSTLIASTVVLHVIFERPLQAVLVAAYKGAIAGFQGKTAAASLKDSRPTGSQSDQEALP
jgi:exopolysaccharide production protein ExoZ